MVSEGLRPKITHFYPIVQAALQLFPVSRDNKGLGAIHVRLSETTLVVLLNDPGGNYKTT